MAARAVQQQQGKAKGGRQTGLAAYVRATPKCLAPRCQQSVPMEAHAQGLAPGLCPSCRGEGGVWQATWVQHHAQHGQQQQRLEDAAASCARCHSGCHADAIACSNGECVVGYARLEAARRLGTLATRLARLGEAHSEPTAMGW